MCGSEHSLNAYSFVYARPPPPIPPSLLVVVSMLWQRISVCCRDIVLQHALVRYHFRTQIFGGVDESVTFGFCTQPDFTMHREMHVCFCVP